MKYFSNKIIFKQNLIDNYLYLKQKSNKNICAVVKANAYGHNAKTVVKILGKYCNFFAVQNLYEAIDLRKINKSSIILILGHCINYELASEYNISVMVESEKQLKEILQKNIAINIHIKINTGMNRFGLKDKTDDKNITNKQIEIFKGYVDLIDKKFSPIVHIGGSNMTNYNVQFASFVRCGISLYGYGDDNLKPVMKIESKIIKILDIKTGENVGYQNGFIANKNMKIALIPLGYADGIPRSLSNNFQVEIYNKKISSIGYVCMDLFMIDVSNVLANVGDFVTVFYNANYWSKITKVTNYEILTGLNNSRTNLLID